MPIVLVAKTQEDYDVWVEEQKGAAAAAADASTQTLTMDELMARGEKSYATNCAACHNVDGSGILPAFPPLKGSAIVLEDKSAHIDIVLNGKPGTYMAAFGPQLSEVDIAALITYERNAWGHNTGDVIQPLEIVEIKEAQAQ